MNIWTAEADGLGTEDVFDPLYIERSAPIDDDEAALIEELCLAATPGPLVVDEQADGDGAVVVSLPDGRLIVSLTAGVEHTQSAEAVEANTQLICKARNVLLRLLRDRQQWNEERETLLERIGVVGNAPAAPNLPR
jgi:hypothetical protein